MGELTDPRPLARVVTIVVAVWMAAEVLLRVAVTAVMHESEPLGTDPLSLRMAGLAALLQIGTYLLSVVVVGRWIWRTNANAHRLANGMSITPGWAVGWFFVPVAGLFKPFEAMKETWQVSHDPDNWPNVAIPALLRWWWGLWIAGNIGANLSFQLTRTGFNSQSLAPFDLAVTVVAIASGVALIRLARTLSATQAQAIAVQAFA